MNRTAFTVLALVLVSGCSSPPDAPPDPGVGDSAGPASPGPPGLAEVDPPAQSLPHELLFTDCQGLYTWFVWPLETNPATQFQGWEPTPREATEVRMMAAECQRVSWGPIERGPVRFVFEYHNDLVPPQACRVATHHSWILNSLWADDAEVVGRLAAVEGMPSRLAQIAVSVQETGPLHVATATWSSSSLVVQQELLDQEPAIMGLPLRLFWANPMGGASAVYFVTDLVDGPAYPSERAASGTIESPMIMSELAGGAYAGPGFMFYGANLGGELSRYRDLLCEQPA